MPDDPRSVQLPPAAYALLGFLASGPASGYDLKGAARISVSHFWSASDSQIYPMLHRLEQEGLVRSERVSGDGRRAKVVFAMTRAGGAALDGWLREAPKPPAFRHPALIRLFFAWRLADGEIRSLIDHRHSELESELALLRDLEAIARSRRPAAPPKHDRREHLMTLVLEWGIEVSEAELRWWNRARRELLPE